MIPAGVGAFKALFDGLEDGVCVADGRGLVQYMNPAAQRLLKRAPDGATPIRVCDALCRHLDLPGGEPQTRACPLLVAGAPERAVTFEGVRSGVFQGLRVRCLRLSREEGVPSSYPAHFIFIEDASDEMRIRHRNEDWRSMMVHDLRVPLSCAFGALRSLQDADARRNPEEAQMLEIGVHSCRKMAELLEEYLDAARLMSGASAEPRPVALDDILAECAREEGPAARARGVALQAAAPNGLKIQGDPRLLTRIIQNLLDNALKHTPRGGKISATAERKGEAVELRVRDTGGGIPAQALSRLFERFFQAPGESGTGAGLGLAFCREAARSMGGDVVVAASSPGGTEMLVTLRAAAREASS